MQSKILHDRVCHVLVKHSATLEAPQVVKSHEYRLKIVEARCLGSPAEYHYSAERS